MHDSLTRLPTRALLREHARVAVARARRHDRAVAVVHVGLDDFALVNDSLGRDSGDAVLRELAHRVRRAVPETHVVARPGADELCVLLADLDGDAETVVDAIAGQVAGTLEQPFSAGARDDVRLGATMGASVFPYDAADEDALLRHADAALRQAKDEQRGGLVFYAGGTSDALRRLLLTARLRGALDRGELFLVFQPIFTWPGRRIPFAEALLRWRDPEGRLVPPLDFIPAAEHTGLIDRIGDWVLDDACRQARAWQEDGHEIAVSVNVSLRQFRSPGFAERVHERLGAHEVHPTRLIVEITESTAMLDAHCVEPVLRDLQRQGVRVAIDDFGTGYSSLGRLRRLQVDLIKIDGGLLPEAGQDGRLLGAALALVEALGLRAVVEGVETAEQCALIDGRGTLVQGFHLARPMTATQLSALLSAA